MCGRYYIDDDTIREIEKLVRQIDKKLLEEKSRDVFPPRVHLWSREERESCAGRSLCGDFPDLKKAG